MESLKGYAKGLGRSSPNFKSIVQHHYHTERRVDISRPDYIDVGIKYGVNYANDFNIINYKNISPYKLPLGTEVDDNGNLEMPTIAISGKPGYGKTTLAKEITMGFMERENDTIALVIGTKEGMQSEWARYKKDAINRGIDCEYHYLEKGADYKIHLSMLNYNSLVSITRLGDGEDAKELMDIFVKYDHDIMEVYEELKKRAMSKKKKDEEGIDIKKYPKWRTATRIVNFITNTPTITADESEALMFDKNMIHIIDFSEQKKNKGVMDMLIGSTLRTIREEVSNKKKYQALVVIDEYLQTVPSDKGFARDTYTEISDIGRNGRQQGVGQLLCFQTAYGRRDIREPLITCKKFITFFPQSHADREFIKKNISPGYKGIESLMNDFFYRRTEQRGACLVFDMIDPDKPMAVQVHPPKK